MTKEHPFKIAMFCAVLTVMVVWVNAGNLNPPGGAISSTMKDLATVEPRTPISSLPFTIAAPGSYYVTKDLMGASGSHGITISSSDVALDLRGFTLRGVNGSMNGIHVLGSRTRIGIRDGMIAGWGGGGINSGSGTKVTMAMVKAEDCDYGVCCGNDHTVVYMQTDGNRTGGIILGNNCVCTDSSALNNTGNGITTGSGCKVEDCVCASNTADGLNVGEGSVVAHCTASQNGGSGIVASSGPGGRGSNITDSIATLNTVHGIAAAPGSTVAACTSQSNTVDGINVGAGCTVSNCTVRGTTGDGIEAASACLVLNNDASANGTGIRIFSSVGGGTRVDSNNTAFNTTFNIDVASAGNLTIRNSSAGPGTGYNFAAGNDFGPIITLGGGGPIASMHPWANFDY